MADVNRHIAASVLGVLWPLEAFEVTGNSLDGLLLFSRLRSARPPTIDEVIAAIRREMPAAGTILGGGSAGGACA